jgi:hypothetical protein
MMGVGWGWGVRNRSNKLSRDYKGQIGIVQQQLKSTVSISSTLREKKSCFQLKNTILQTKVKHDFGPTEDFDTENCCRRLLVLLYSGTKSSCLNKSNVCCGIVIPVTSVVWLLWSLFKKCCITLCCWETGAACHFHCHSRSRNRIQNLSILSFLH